MLVRIFTLTFNSAQGGFEDSELREFMRDKEIIAITDHLFIRNEIPYLTLIVKYYPFRKEVQPENKSSSNKRDESWKDDLSEADMGVFNLLRDWRSERCKKEGVPPYILFNNKQLAEVVKMRPQSSADLLKIEGIGKAKAEKYGEDILKITLKEQENPTSGESHE